jgi:putative hydrolase of the HAD superfamily
MVEGAGVEPLDARALARELRAVYTASHHWKVYEDTIPVLQALRESGWRHLMLSNHVPELSRLVADLGLHGYFTAIFCSADIGVEKPHPQAFERVFAAYPAAREGWMIGDSWTADVCGADRVGLRSILVRRAHPAATLRCETLHEVVPLLAGSR